ncbi:SIMPL domain-containing protein [Paenibacillus lentus]|uniref:DUF541 domain-containing protein n=1 Tax=Paenibacillus lentus TaxID=1338368 RepID=A0A3Q8S9B8_9BACL|nr:SIMPL domain-containing protein [Paenibacillus lentus]AZK45432.1 DUF541 domain-containing protein [Paenibacillus lentus]
MKKWFKPVGAVLIAGVLISGGSFISGGLELPQPVYADNEVQRNVINVTGSGEIQVKPDVAYISVGIETQADTAKEAQSQNAAKMAKVSTLLKDTWKLDAKDMKTGQFSVQPNYTYSEKEGQKVKGYTVYHTLSITYRDLDKVGQLLDELTKAGANRIDNIRFSTENPDQYQEQVIQKAMANADMKAAAIAKAAKRQVGLVLSVTQGSGNDYSPYMNMSFAVAEKTTMDRATSIEPGEITVKTTLSVMYEMK